MGGGLGKGGDLDCRGGVRVEEAGSDPSGLADPVQLSSGNKLEEQGREERGPTDTSLECAS